ncbi:MAG TPA: c-type cytochrome [Longimicrobium sp.]|jgi:mono/diheme cytochrome c family protein
MSTPRPPHSAALPALLAAIVAGCAGPASPPLPALSASAVGDTAGLVQRGEHLVRNVSVCGHCHAPPATRNADGPLSGGAEFRNWRLGTIRAANLTPDSATGIGAWSDAEIVRAIRTGVSRDGRLLAPVMPYEWLSSMSERDAMAIARYLKSQPAVRHEVRSSPNLVFRAARAVILHPAHPRQGMAPRPGPTAEYGGYLADGPGLCADCHTPRGGIQSAADRDRLYAGDATPPAAFPANPSNLTPDSATGIGRWSEGDFVRTLRTGVDPAGARLHPFMPWREYRRMSDDELAALYRYLRTLPPIRNPVPRRSSAGA